MIPRVRRFLLGYVVSGVALSLYRVAAYTPDGSPRRRKRT